MVNKLLLLPIVLVLIGLVGFIALSPTNKTAIKNYLTKKITSEDPAILGFRTKRSRRLPSPTPTPKPTATPTSKPSVVPTKIPSPVPTTPPVTNQSIAWGTYTGWMPSDITTFETKVGKPIKLLATFVHWGNEKEFPQDLAQVAKTGGKTIVIYWEAMDYNFVGTEDTRFSYDAILAGKWDSYIRSFADSVRSYGAPVILIPFEEANGDWYPWSGTKNGNTIEKHKQAFQHLRGFFAGISNVKFAWDTNCESVSNTSANDISNYYPGDAYVDYLGVNGFNFGSPWMSFSQIFNSALATLETLNKPIYIFSTASAPGPLKPDWIKNAFGVEVPKHPKIAGWVWFNENKEKDWRVWSDTASLEAFKSILP